MSRNKEWYKTYDVNDPRVRVGQWIKIVREDGKNEYFTQITSIASRGFHFKEQDGYIASYNITGGCYRFIPDRWIRTHGIEIDVRSREEAISSGRR